MNKEKVLSPQYPEPACYLPLPGPGAPSTIPQETLNEVVRRIEAGETQQSIVDSGLISWQTLCNRKRGDSAFLEAVQRARETSSHVWFDKAAGSTIRLASLDVMAYGKAASAEVARYDKMFMHRLEIAKRLNPAEYGDKQQVEHTGSIELVARMAEGTKRAAEASKALRCTSLGPAVPSKTDPNTD